MSIKVETEELYQRLETGIELFTLLEVANRLSRGSLAPDAAQALRALLERSLLHQGEHIESAWSDAGRMVEALELLHHDLHVEDVPQDPIDWHLSAVALPSLPAVAERLGDQPRLLLEWTLCAVRQRILTAENAPRTRVEENMARWDALSARLGTPEARAVAVGETLASLDRLLAEAG